MKPMSRMRSASSSTMDLDPRRSMCAGGIERRPGGHTTSGRPAGRRLGRPRRRRRSRPSGPAGAPTSEAFLDLERTRAAAEQTRRARRPGRLPDPALAGSAFRPEIEAKAAVFRSVWAPASRSPPEDEGAPLLDGVARRSPSRRREELAHRVDRRTRWRSYGPPACAARQATDDRDRRRGTGVTRPIEHERRVYPSPRSPGAIRPAALVTAPALRPRRAARGDRAPGARRLGPDGAAARPCPELPMGAISPAQSRCRGSHALPHGEASLRAVGHRGDDAAAPTGHRPRKARLGGSASP